MSLIFTTYYPPSDFEIKINNILPVCDNIIIVDNTWGGYQFQNLPRSVIVIQDGQNNGLAVAINLGIKYAIKLKATYIMLFDQDSYVTNYLINNLYNSIIKANAIFGRQICIGPTHDDDKNNKQINIEDHNINYSKYKLVTQLPTSGITFCLEQFENTDFFNENYFLDFADFEWCWRLAKKGWKYYCVTDLIMFHRLGLSEYSVLNIKFYKITPIRHYYQVRDALQIAREPHTPFHWKFRLLIVIPFKLIIYPFIFSNGFERIIWSLKGFWDFTRNIKGIGAGMKKLA
ncbi:MAG: glycosyltransferase [Segetibacter sp.]